jgi:biopolymer transport protein ExbB
MRYKIIFFSFMIVWSLTGAPVQAAVSPLDELLAQVRQGRTEAAQEHREREQRFLSQQAQQQERLAQAKRELEAERQRSARLQQAFAANETRLAGLNAKLREHSGVLLELFGHARQAAGDVQALFRSSLVSTQLPQRGALVAKLAGDKSVPGISELEDLWYALQQEMTEAGKVVSYRAPVIGVDGKSREQTVTRVGVFNAVSGGRFLRHLPDTGALQELSRQPSAAQRALAAGLEQATGGMPTMVIDPSRGAVLALLVQMPDLLERIQQGKAVGYIIIALGLIGLLLALERWLHLALVGQRMRRQLASELPDRKNPLGRVMAVYQGNPEVDTGTLELLLDEAIIKNIPRLRWGLQALKILAAVTPLLGLLGTVVGLIETFQVITLFGSGNPKLMAGGISEALVTTVLGLSAAIPLILVHSILAGKSRRLVSILEEQSAGIVARHAERRGGHAAAA